MTWRIEGKEVTDKEHDEWVSQFQEKRKLKLEPGFEPGTRVQEIIPLGLPPGEYRHGVVTDHYVGMNPDDAPPLGYWTGASVSVLWDGDNKGYRWCETNRMMKE